MGQNIDIHENHFLYIIHTNIMHGIVGKVEGDKIKLLVGTAVMNEFIYCSLAWKWMSGRKKKTPLPLQYHEAYLFHLKGSFQVTLQSLPGDIFQLDILWHFPLNIAAIPAAELKAFLVCDLKRQCLERRHGLTHAVDQLRDARYYEEVVFNPGRMSPNLIESKRTGDAENHLAPIFIFSNDAGTLTCTSTRAFDIVSVLRLWRQNILSEQIRLQR